VHIDHLIRLSHTTLGMKTEKYKRFLHEKLHPDTRLIGIKGPQGAGKTKLVRQCIEASGYDTFPLKVIFTGSSALHEGAHEQETRLPEIQYLRKYN
jgi:Ni2+-binding GTPase involved in maturation of urease and hydrogenase